APRIGIRTRPAPNVDPRRSWGAPARSWGSKRVRPPSRRILTSRRRRKAPHAHWTPARLPRRGLHGAPNGAPGGAAHPAAQRLSPPTPTSEADGLSDARPDASHLFYVAGLLGTPT